MRKMIIFDDFFPDLLTSFRIAEFNYYLEFYPETEVYSSNVNFKKSYREYSGLYPDLSKRVFNFSADNEFADSFGYTIFLNNAYKFLPVFLKNNMPFSFTLYPGGGFFIDDEESDKKLSTIFNSVLFRKVIVTQKIIYDYLIKKRFCKKDQIEFIYGGVFPLDVYNNLEIKKNKYKEDKQTFDICFVANKYIEKGIDKGYDLFIDCAKEIFKKHQDVRFHVVGGFSEDDIEISGLGPDVIKFYGNLKTSDFPKFYSDKDIILSPNRPFILHDGAFDGFPTGSCIEAGCSDVALFVADPLELNIYFEDKKDIVIISNDLNDIINKVEEYYLKPKELYKLAQKGKEKIIHLLNMEKQMNARLNMFTNDLLKENVHDLNLIKKINSEQLLNIDLFNENEQLNKTLKLKHNEFIYQNRLLDKQIKINKTLQNKIESLQNENIKKELQIHNLELQFNSIINSREFLAGKFLRKIVQIIIPKFSRRRQAMVFLFNVLKFNKKNINFDNSIKKDLNKKNNNNDKISIAISDKKKILVLPSWYPTADAPFAGTFFQEQSELMNEEFDVKVLYGIGRELETNKTFEIEQNLIAFPPEAVGFYFNQRSDLTEEGNLELMMKAYEEVLDLIIKEGWVPDLIHAHSTAYGGIVGNYLKSKRGIPLIITEHQMFLLHNFSKHIQNLIFNALEEADFVGAVSTDKIKFILMHGIKCEPVFVGNLVNDELFYINTENNKKENIFEIIIVAGASYIKDLYTFFRALRLMQQEGINNFHATIIGNGIWGGEDYYGFAENIGVLEKCTFVDQVKREEMVKYYNNADVFVSSSIAEGFQVSILEAMACGLPVVSTMHGGAEDIITPDNGILVKIRDYEAIARELINIKNGDIEFDKQKIRNNVIKRFGRTAFSKQIGRLYENIIENETKTTKN